jgi:SAM-dependent methyltransferase
VAQKAGRAIGLDITSEFTEKAKGLAPSAEFYSPEEFKEENTADLVYCFMVMQHSDATSRERIMDHIFRLLDPGGFAVLNFPSIESGYYTENEFCHKFTREEVISLAQPFRSCRIIKGNLPGYASEVKGFNEHFLIAVK